MADNNKKILKGINFPGLEGTYYIPEVIIDDTLTEEGQAAEAAAVGALLAEKAQVQIVTWEEDD